jgi:hypothetical protein
LFLDRVGRVLSISNVGVPIIKSIDTNREKFKVREGSNKQSFSSFVLSLKKSHFVLLSFHNLQDFDIYLLENR